ncbi:alpha-N-acetylgalactosaminidase-like isoform X1 [Acropora millepora]|uniref:alpha-N-acetylgalactosaminidase-like isoform X1 n=1 Tax=Acropora millepora TaxID=45264 RepID=UPI001CF3966C|nr:alpha-N-acetylgalactosaminidase-like isoform X1 [Acropora millepora]
MAGGSWKVVALCFILNVGELFQNTLVCGLDNGLALTPPMGWMDWERFRCNIDCNKDPDNCISEHLIKQQADRLAEDGYKDAGYEYVSIDDCWSNKKRDSSGNLQPNSTRFPSGMKALGDYLHNKGLKFGMYADYGLFTCAGYPGSLGYIEQDAKTFANWGVDYLKVDGCFSNPAAFDDGFPKFTQAFNATGRPVLLSYEWPLYQSQVGIKPDYDAIARSCNTWRNYVDVQDSWSSVLKIVDHFAGNQDTFIAAAGPGHWNDPDMLVIGDFGLNHEQSKAQFGLWSILAAPLIMSNDLRNISSKAKDILLNREVIAVDQDMLGKMGRRVLKQNDTEVWSRPLSNSSVAVLLFNRNANKVQVIEADIKMIGLVSNVAFARDLFNHQDLGFFINVVRAEVNPTGVVMMKLDPIEYPIYKNQFSELA